jgi:1-acyl-sn-glycerol-3-phosphate acyltransferase
LVVFVEGTRTLDGNLQPAKKGSGMLLYNARVPVVPAYIDGTFQAWPKGKLLPRRHPTSVTYGPPIDLTDLYRAEPTRETYSRIASRVTEKIAALKPSPKT